MAKSVPVPINLVNERKRPHFLRMPLTPHVPPQQLDAVYTGWDKVTIVNLFFMWKVVQALGLRQKQSGVSVYNLLFCVRCRQCNVTRCIIKNHVGKTDFQMNFHAGQN